MSQNNNVQFKTTWNPIQVTATPHLAKVRINSKDVKDPVTAEAIFQALKNSEVIHGIHEETVHSIVDQKQWDKDIAVAFYTEPLEGEDGRIEEIVNISQDASPMELEDGSIDYRNISTFTVVQEGCVVAKVYKPKAGRNGLNVFGHPIFPKRVIDWSEPNGKNIRFDGEHDLVAEKTGILYRVNGVIHLETTLEIKGSVDYSTGNINFMGDVLVHGDVKPGFEIIAGGDIEVRGNVESAVVASSQGNVTIRGGVLGKKVCTIQSHGDTHLGYAQGAQLNIGADLSFDKYLMNCQTKVMGKISSDNLHSFISGGETLAQTGITVQQVGQRSETRTIVKLGFIERERYMKTVRSLQEQSDRLHFQLEAASKKLLAYKESLNHSPNSAGNIKKVMIDLIEEYKELNCQWEKKQAAIQRLQSDLEAEDQRTRHLKIERFIFPNTTLVYGEEKQTFNSQAKGIKVRIDAHGIAS